MIDHKILLIFYLIYLMTSMFRYIVLSGISGFNPEYVSEVAQ